LDDKEILVPVTDIINPKTVIRIEKQGLIRDTNESQIRGDLYVKFMIEFPKFLSYENKELLKEIL
jgi:DnaJ-class molecular chaperone